MTEQDALALLRNADKLISARGQKVVEVDLKKEKPSLDLVRTSMLGPTGNLRAPTFRVGKTIVVGFHEETYRKLLR